MTFRGFNMKRPSVIFIAVMITILLSTGSVWGETEKNPGKNQKFITLTIGSGGKAITDSDFKEVYGSIIPSWHMGLGIFLWDSLELFFRTDFYNKKGKETLSGEETSIRVFPIEMGLTFFLSQNKVQPFIGLGGGYYTFKEEASIGTASSQTFGFFSHIGVRYHLKKKFYIELMGKYSQFKTDSEPPEESGIYMENKSVKGLALLIGLGFIL